MHVLRTVDHSGEHHDPSQRLAHRLTCEHQRWSSRPGKELPHQPRRRPVTKGVAQDEHGRR